MQTKTNAHAYTHTHTHTQRVGIFIELPVLRNICKENAKGAKHPISKPIAISAATTGRPMVPKNAKNFCSPPQPPSIASPKLKTHGHAHTHTHHTHSTHITSFTCMKKHYQKQNKKMSQNEYNQTD